MDLGKPMSHEDKAKTFKWASISGVIMTLFGWAFLFLADDLDILLVPTTFVILSLSILLANHQYDEFHRDMARAGAIGGMMAVLLWTACSPLIADFYGKPLTDLIPAMRDPRFTFFVAATGFFVGFYNKQWRGG